MPGMTLAQAEAGFQSCYNALLAAHDKKSYTVADRSLQMQEIDKLKAALKDWQADIDRLTPGEGSRLRAGVALP